MNEAYFGTSLLRRRQKRLRFRSSQLQRMDSGNWLRCMGKDALERKKGERRGAERIMGPGGDDPSPRKCQQKFQEEDGSSERKKRKGL